MKKTTNRLSLKKVEVSELNKTEQLALNGGFLSIGHECSINNTCGRLVRAQDTEAVFECFARQIAENGDL